jgi:hypothetical protein
MEFCRACLSHSMPCRYKRRVRATYRPTACKAPDVRVLVSAFHRDNVWALAELSLPRCSSDVIHRDSPGSGCRIKQPNCLTRLTNPAFVPGQYAHACSLCFEPSDTPRPHLTTSHHCFLPLLYELTLCSTTLSTPDINTAHNNSLIRQVLRSRNASNILYARHEGANGVADPGTVTGFHGMIHELCPAD